MEEDDSKKHFNLKSIIKNEKLRKKRKKEQQETKQDDFKIDVNDRRFSALYSSHLYAVDPSDPLFKYVKNHLHNLLCFDLKTFRNTELGDLTFQTCSSLVSN